jgi:cell division protein FtsW (lipid II flippase)
MPTLKKRKILNKFLQSQKTESKPKFDWPLILVVAILTILGLAFLASSLATKDSQVFISQFIHQFIFGVWIGIVVAFIFARLDYHQLFKYKNILLIVTFGSLIYIALPIIIAQVLPQNRYQLIDQMERFLPIYPYYANNAVRWLTFMGRINFQPTELAKITLGIIFAERLQKTYTSSQSITAKTLVQPFCFFLAFAVLVIIQPDLGSIILAALIILTVMFIGKVPLRILVSVTLAITLVGVLAAFSVEYRRERILATQCQQNSQESWCYQITQVKKAVGDGGLWGKGYANGEVKFDKRIPEISNDAIIAVIGEEMGFVFIVIFLGLYLVILLRGMQIANKAPDIGGKSLATAFSVWITAQAFLNVSGMTGLTPSKGLTLPFVSEGGTSMVIVFIAIGILLNISSQSTENQ